MSFFQKVFSVFALGILLNLGEVQANPYDSLSFYDVLDKEFYSTQDIFGDRGLVVLFTSLHCPYSKIYDERLSEIRKEYEDKGVSFVLVNANDPSIGGSETLDAMRRRAVELKVRYVSDQSHSIKEALGVTKNGEIVILARDAKKGVKVFYDGAMDDNPIAQQGIGKNYLRLALDNMVKGLRVPPIRNMHPIGCVIR